MEEEKIEGTEEFVATPEVEEAENLEVKEEVTEDAA